MLDGIKVSTIRRSPRTRGDGPRHQLSRNDRRVVLPARAGMARWIRKGRPSIGSFSPHARGWPEDVARLSQVRVRSPRTRGDGPECRSYLDTLRTVLPARAGMAQATDGPWDSQTMVLPARAGMARSATRWSMCRNRSPRTRGDGPGDGRRIKALASVLPARAGMALVLRAFPARALPVLPARAGMARSNAVARGPLRRSPRTRGDGPTDPTANKFALAVLPARAGMARVAPVQRFLVKCVLPARAGMARWIISVAADIQAFSPHARGWPGLPGIATEQRARSPRTRGDGPGLTGQRLLPPTVLPARAGMARSGRERTGRRHCSPRTRGDGPSQHDLGIHCATFSPHARGWPVPGTARLA